MFKINFFKQRKQRKVKKQESHAFLEHPTNKKVMKIYTVESLLTMYVQDLDLFEEVTKINLDNYERGDLIQLTNEQITKLKKLEAFDETALY